MRAPANPTRWALLMSGLLGLCAPAIGRGQVAQSTAAPTSTDPAELSNEMAEELRRLADDLDQALSPSDAKLHLIEDARELARTVDDFRASTEAEGRSDRSRLRRDYAGIGDGWQALRPRVQDPGVAKLIVSRAARRVDEIDAALRRALGLDPVPPEAEDGNPVPASLAESRRLARSLDDRARTLAETVRAEIRGAPGMDAIAEEAADLARATTLYREAIAKIDRADLPQSLFAPAASVASALEQQLRLHPIPPGVASAWRSFATVEHLLKTHLGLPTPPPTLEAEQEPLVAPADRLIARSDDFLRSFAPAAATVPDGPGILADARRLRIAAAEFREEAAGGLDLPQLAFKYRAVDATWQRLARRINRAGDRPELQTAPAVAEAAADLHRRLGLPGASPAIGKPAPRP